MDIELGNAPHFPRKNQTTTTNRLLFHIPIRLSIPLQWTDIVRTLQQQLYLVVLRAEAIKKRKNEQKLKENLAIQEKRVDQVIRTELHDKVRQNGNVVLKYSDSFTFQIPLSERLKQFKELMKEKNVCTTSTWEREISKIVFDSRFLLLDEPERRAAFENYTRTQANIKRGQTTTTTQSLTARQRKRQRRRFLDLCFNHMFNYVSIFSVFKILFRD